DGIRDFHVTGVQTCALPICSPIFSDSHDFSCFISDLNGSLISVADGIPIHTGSGGFAVAAVLRDWPEQIAPGDIFILSDPYEAAIGRASGGETRSRTARGGV